MTADGMTADGSMKIDRVISTSTRRAKKERNKEATISNY